LNVTWRDDKFHDECGVFGIWNHPEAANVTYLGLYALQHRGQESAGIAASDGQTLHTEKAMGWVADVFTPERLRRLPGHRAIGHVRYSTAGASRLRNAQPITASTARGPIAIAHNGNLTNAEALRQEMERDGAIFQSTSDTEVILHLLARAPAGPREEQLPQALARVKGAYSLLILTPEAMYAVRDPHGFRPLVLGCRWGADANRRGGAGAEKAFVPSTLDRGVLRAAASDPGRLLGLAQRRQGQQEEDQERETGSKPGLHPRLQATCRRGLPTSSLTQRWSAP
jgi:amidophosphoribosyltransferase